MSNTKVTTAGASIFLMYLVFIVLTGLFWVCKIKGMISWDWFWVFSPVVFATSIDFLLAEVASFIEIIRRES